MDHKDAEHTQRRSVYIEGDAVDLRPLERDDLTDRYLAWLNDPEVNHYLEVGRFPQTMADLEAFYEQVTSSGCDVLLAIVDKASGEHVGNIKLGNIDWVHRNAELGLMIGDRAAWGKGLGSEAVDLLVTYAFNRLNLHRIVLGVHADNDAARRVYEKAGFVVEGRLRENTFLDGAYVDGLIMSLLATEHSA